MSNRLESTGLLNLLWFRGLVLLQYGCGGIDVCRCKLWGRLWSGELEPLACVGVVVKVLTPVNDLLDLSLKLVLVFDFDELWVVQWIIRFYFVLKLLLIILSKLVFCFCNLILKIDCIMTFQTLLLGFFFFSLFVKSLKPSQFCLIYTLLTIRAFLAHFSNLFYFLWW